MITVGAARGESVRPGDGAEPCTNMAYGAKPRALAGAVTARYWMFWPCRKVGGSEALADLMERLDGIWHSGLADPDGPGIRVGVLSRWHLSNVDQAVNFPAGVRPIQIDDDSFGAGVHERKYDHKIDRKSLSFQESHIVISTPRERGCA